MTDCAGAEPGERTAGRLGYRAGYYDRGLITRVGVSSCGCRAIVPGSSPTALFERFGRSEKALVSALAEMYVQAQQSRVKAITEKLRGSVLGLGDQRHQQRVYETLTRFACGSPSPIRRRALREGARGRHHPEPSRRWPVPTGRKPQLLGVERATGGERLQRLWWGNAGGSGVEFVVSDDHAGLKKAITEILPEAAWQRCYVHFLRNALDYLPRKAGDACPAGAALALRWAQPGRGATRSGGVPLAEEYLKLTNWVEENIGETLLLARGSTIAT